MSSPLRSTVHSQLKLTDDGNALTSIGIDSGIKPNTYIFIRHLFPAIHHPLYLVLISGCVGEGHEPVARVTGTGAIEADGNAF